ncbi:hypothetical protein Tco_0580204 [Tanacetum coccineum]
MPAQVVCFGHTRQLHESRHRYRRCDMGFLRVKWKKRNLDASLVALSARMLSTMLRKSLMWSKRFLGTSAVFGSVVSNGDTTSSKRFCPAMVKDSFCG